MAGPAVPFRTDDLPAWIDYPLHNVTEPVAPDASRVPTPEDAKSQAWERKAVQACKVLEECEAWRKTLKPRDR